VTPALLPRLEDTLQRAAARAAARQTSRRLRVGLPVALVVGAVVLVDATQSILPGGGAFLLLLLPVMVVGITLGFVSGLFALLLGAVGAWLLVPLRGHPWLSDPTHVARFGLYLLEGAGVLLLVFTLHRALRTGRRQTTLTLPPAKTLEAPSLREREVLALAATGLSARAIGERLFLSENTIKSHLARAYAKLGARNRAEAVAASLQAGWIKAADPTEL
jgi:DNA-binding CsgD family transcriptional regulator